MAQKTLLLTAFHSFISKNILNTDVFAIIRAKSEWQVVLLVPESKKGFFEETYDFPNVTIEQVDVNALASRKVVTRFSRLAYLLLKSNYLEYKKVERLKKGRTFKSLLKFSGEWLATRLLSRFGLARRFLRWAFMKCVQVQAVSVVFDKYSPDAVFSTDVFDESDLLFSREAKARGIPIIGMVRSWDNCYSKGVLRVIPDALVVNTNELKEEAAALHGVPAETIFVGGLPQFDASLSEPRTPREAFFNRIAADPSKRLILFAPAGSILSDTDWQIADILKKAIKDGRIKHPSQVFVRNHPNHPADFSKFESDDSFMFELPGRSFSQNIKEAELTMADTRHLRDLIFHSDVIIYVATTLGIDSLPFDKPQIIINFDGYEEKSYNESVRRYHDEDHMKKMIKLHGVNLVSSPEELIRAINMYLDDPSVDRDGRRLMVTQQLYKLDGKSGERIGAYVSGKMDELTTNV